MMTEPIWISVELAEAIHQRQLAEHGGPGGVRDHNLLDSALARPRQQFAYGDESLQLPDLAAAYAFGLAHNHPFVDGNKRTPYVLCRTFLKLNGWDMVGDLTDRYPVFLALAAGELNEDALAEWLRRHCRPDQVSESAAEYA